MNKVKAKVAVLGNKSVGKSCLIQSWQNGNCSKDYVMTQALEITTQMVELSEGTQRDIELYLFDAGGQELYRNFLPDLLRETNLVMLVFDITDRISFEALDSWYELLTKANNNVKRIPGVLVGTKMDLTNLRKVELTEAIEYGKKLGLQYYETSPIRNMDVEQPFLALGKLADEHLK
eukprot:TRINITY_DN18126_c0_g1_i1.p3 TRINITY_DN18126_c0_g1~~TRINITY_DN18126_c0_g1_i1.p3  ORF type:complete len:177 (-),score=29.21 TRINITY_DN18126_c0_g1_i1:151-681(-)